MKRWFWLPLAASFSLISEARPVPAPDETLLGQLRTQSRIVLTETFELPAVADPSSWRSHFLQNGEVTSRRETPGYLKKNDPYCEVRLLSPLAQKLALAKTLVLSSAPQVWYQGWTSPQSVILPILGDNQIESLICRRSSGPQLSVKDLRTVFGGKVKVEFFAQRGDSFPAGDSKPLTDTNRADERLELKLGAPVAAALKINPQAVFQKGGVKDALAGSTGSRDPWCLATVRSAGVVRNWQVRGELGQLNVEESANGYSFLTFHSVVDRLPVTLTCHKTGKGTVTVGDVRAAMGDSVSIQIIAQE